uniref:(northern house mosquito) hypothetical protein n=1 Tax=Culex pipiens TaxID=7175 RepID=A0A8D8PCZ7_CULPI
MYTEEVVGLGRRQFDAGVFQIHIVHHREERLDVGGVVELGGRPHQLAVLAVDVDEEGVVLEDDGAVVLQVKLAGHGRPPPEHDVARFVVALFLLADGTVLDVPVEHLVAVGGGRFPLREDYFVGPLAGGQLDLVRLVAEADHGHGERGLLRLVLAVGDVDDVPSLVAGDLLHFGTTRSRSRRQRRNGPLHRPSNRLVQRVAGVPQATGGRSRSRNGLDRGTPFDRLRRRRRWWWWRRIRRGHQLNVVVRVGQVDRVVLVAAVGDQLGEGPAVAHLHGGVEDAGWVFVGRGRPGSVQGARGAEAAVVVGFVQVVVVVAGSLVSVLVGPSLAHSGGRLHHLLDLVRGDDVRLQHVLKVDFVIFFGGGGGGGRRLTTFGGGFVGWSATLRGSIRPEVVHVDSLFALQNRRHQFGVGLWLGWFAIVGIAAAAAAAFVSIFPDVRRAGRSLLHDVANVHDPNGGTFGLGTIRRRRCLPGRKNRINEIQLGFALRGKCRGRRLRSGRRHRLGQCLGGRRLHRLAR